MAVRRWDLLTISTHYDDAAFSVALPLMQHRGRAAIVTVFGGAPDPAAPVSDWDRRCGFTSAREAVTTRRAEDLRACQLLGVDQVALGHADNPYQDPDPPLPGLADFLGDLDRSTTILVPLGVGNVDHLNARNRSLLLLGDLGFTDVSLYADLPYSSEVPGWLENMDTWRAHPRLAGSRSLPLDGKRLGTSTTFTLDTDAWVVKRAAAWCHTSQLAPMAADHGRFMYWPGCLQREVVWRLD